MSRSGGWIFCGRSILLLIVWLGLGLGWSLTTADASKLSFRRRHRDNQRTSTIHDRLSYALQYHPEFENVTLPIVQQTFRRGLRDNEHKTTSTSTSTSAINDVPWTLNQARIIHQLALDATRAVQRSHGHIVAIPQRSSNSGDSSLMVCQTGSTVPSSSIASCPKTRRRFVPTDYGADPTGVRDSTEAFARLMQDFLQPQQLATAATTTMPYVARPMAANITNLGGAILDLQGGTYLLSQPIVIPPMYGNAHIIDGTLQASSSSFPSDRWLIEIGSDDKELCHPKLPDGKDDTQYSCNEFLDVTRVLLDANFVAAGGIRFSRVMGTTLDEIFVTGFVQVGILIQSGHEVMISNAWLAECYWSFNQYCSQKLHSTSVGIRIHGMDHYLTNIIVFDFAKVGVEILQPANILEGVHTWNGGGHGIVVKSHSVRLIGCYLDFETLDLWSPIVNILVESTFFYYGHVILHAGDNRNSNNIQERSTIDGLILRFNHYNTNQSVVLDGTFEVIKSVSVQDELGGGGGGPLLKTTRASAKLSLRNATEWTLDFSDQLLFPSMIDHVTYSLASSSTGTVVSHMARPPNGTQVTVVTSAPIDATVYMTVEQGMTR